MAVLWFFILLLGTVGRHYVIREMSILQDLCQLTSGEQPYWLVGVTEMTRTFGLELLESILKGYPNIFLNVRALELGNCIGAAEDKLVYQLSVDEGNRRRDGDNSWRFER